MPIHAISFSIPESKIVKDSPSKTKEYAHIVPGNMKTYVFENEDDYYKDYQLSMFGRTCKKGGWDCLRHYEILANGCIPRFPRIQDIPSHTMTHFPKQLIEEATESSEPETYIPRLLSYTRNHLTCRAMAKYILDTIGESDAKRVLYLSSNPLPDYLRCLTLIGFKQLLGTNCIDSVHIPHIYDDYPYAHALYGKGFTYTCILPVSYKTSSITVVDILRKSFDVIVYGSFHRGLPYWNEVRAVYPHNKIVMLCGEDFDDKTDQHICSGTQYAQEGIHVFIRELV